jgi:hypothetical protein
MIGSKAGINRIGVASLILVILICFVSIFLHIKTVSATTESDNLIVHQETTTIGSSTYYQLKKNTAADNSGINLSTGTITSAQRYLFGKAVYPLASINSINASTLTFYYRTWQDSTSVAYDNSASNYQASGTTLSWNHVVGTGSNRLIIVSVGVFPSSGQPTTVSSVTCAGNAMTLLSTDMDNSNSTYGYLRAYTYYYANPPSGTDNILVTFAADTKSVGGSASFLNVNQTTPIENYNTNHGSVVASENVVGNSSGTGRIAYSSLSACTNSATPITDNASWTRQWYQLSQLYKGVGDSISIGSGNITASWIDNQNYVDYVTQIAVINPVSAPTGHAEVDILVRQSDNTVRTTLATGVAQSGSITTTEQTLSGTCTISAYSVVQITDYLELDFYDNVTTAGSSTAYLKIDNNGIIAGSQTESDNWNFTKNLDYNLLENTRYVSGAVEDLVSNDNSTYMTFRSYPSAFSGDVQVAENEAEVTYNATTDYQDRVTLTWTPATADNYLIIATAEIKQYNGNGTTRAQLTIDGVSVAETYVADGGTAWGYRSFVGFKISNLTASSHTIKIQYGVTDTNNLAYIRNARLVVMRIGNKFKASEPADGQTTSTSYTNIATLTFTPDITENWLILAHADIGSAYGGNFGGVLENIDGENVGELYVNFISQYWYLPAAFSRVVSLSGGTSHTLKVQIKSASGVIMAYKNVHLYAIPTAAVFRENFWAENRLGGSTTVVAPGDNTTTLNFTPSSAGDYLILATGDINTSSTSAYVGSRLTVGGTIYGNSIVYANYLGHWAQFAIQKRLTNLSGAQTATISFYTQTAGTPVYIRNARIVALRLPPASQFTENVEFTGISNTQSWDNLIWAVDSQWSAASVAVTLQLYNYNLGRYAQSGENGYLSYTSSSTLNTDETYTQTITTNPSNFRDSGGNFKIKVAGVKSTSTQFDLKVDWIDYEPSWKPVVRNIYIIDTNNNVASNLYVYTLYKFKVEVRDNNNLSDDKEVWLKIYENTKSQGGSDNEQNHYTFKWVRGSGFFEIGPDNTTPYDHLLTDNCVAGNDGLTTDNFVFVVKLSQNADNQSSWSAWAQVVDKATFQDNKEFTNIFTVNSGYNLLENTTYISGTVENVKTSDNTYMTLRSYPSGGGPIAFDASSSGNNGTGGTSITWSHTTGSGSDRIMFVGVSIRTGTVTVSSITYGAQSLTFIRRENLSSICSEVWYLIAPNSGTGTVTVNLSASSEAAGGSITYTGVNQTSPIDNSAGGTGTSNSPSQSVTVNTAYSWLLGHVAISGSDKTVSSEGSGQTSRWDNVTTSAPSLTYDSENSINNNSSTVSTLSWLHNVGSGSNGLIIVSVYAFGGSPPTTVSSITCAGTAMTLLCTDNKTATSGNVRGYTYYLTNPPSGSDNINVTFAANTLSIGGSASFYNVDQTTPIENYATATGESNSASVKGNSSGAGRIAYASVGAIKGSSITITDNTSWTTIFRENSVAPSANIRKIVGCYISTNSGGITASWAISSTASWVAQIAVINPLSAASTRSREHGSDKGPVGTGSQSMSWGLSASADWAVSVVAFRSAATEYRENVEFAGLSNTQTWDNLVWAVESQWTAASVSVILQLYNYNLGRYAQSGEDGYITYTSSGTANTDETYTQTITTNPGNFRDSTGNWKIKVSGVKTTTTQFDLKVDWVDYEPSSGLNTIDITLSNVPINYGTVNPGTENNPASDNTHGFPMTIKVESTTTVNVDIYLKGTNLSDGAGHTIGVDNCKYDDDNTLGEGPEIGQPENTLQLSYPGTANSGYFENVTPGSSKNIYFWISIPLGQWAGTYTNNVYIKAVKDGTIP